MEKVWNNCVFVVFNNYAKINNNFTIPITNRLFVTINILLLIYLLPLVTRPFTIGSSTFSVKWQEFIEASIIFLRIISFPTILFYFPNLIYYLINQ